jgi:endonuclease YncB( thermonuclease family)
MSWKAPVKSRRCYNLSAMGRRGFWPSITSGVFVACLAFLTSCTSQPSTEHYEAIDGDSLREVLSDGSTVEMRYIAINAIAKEHPLGAEARELNARLIQAAQDEGTIFVDRMPVFETDGGQDVYGRPLVRVLLASEEKPCESIGVRLVAEGLARLDVRDPVDKNIAAGEDFGVLCADRLIEAQIEAARLRKGLWGELDEHGESDVAIAAIKQWGEDEIVYIINRGQQPVDLQAGWRLTDSSGHELRFSDSQCLPIPPGGILRVHSGVSLVETEPSDCSGGNLLWRSSSTWNQDGDTAFLYDPEGVLKYEYSYPLKGDRWE